MNEIKPIYLASGLFAILFVFSLLVYWQRGKTFNDMVIADDVALLAKIFDTIHQECGIVDFEHQKNNIDFLNVISFEGSEVGPMNLKNPKKWKGAYLKDNPTIQEKYYQVVHAKNGYYIVPGPAVKLANGKVIGKDILFEKDTDIDALIKTVLHFNDRPLAIRISTGSEKPRTLETVDENIMRDRLRGM